MAVRRPVPLGVPGAPVGLRLLSILLSNLLVLQPLAAQVDSSPKLRIQILDGDGAINDIRQRTAREPVVQVEDENNRPVAGAVVAFVLPDRGASGIFGNGSRTATALTDQRGQAIGRGLRPNKVVGKFEIRVNASHQGTTGAATVTQTNILTAAAAAAGIPLAKLITILVIAGGGAAGGAIAGTRGGGGPGGGAGNTTGPPPTPTTVSAGVGTVGPPR